MKPQETKNEFIKLRAEGKSYDSIASELHISKGTCCEWEKELKEAIAELKQQQLNALYESYHMTKEARIKELGGVLERIDSALSDADLSEMSPEKLLDYKLKYTEAIKGEYLGTAVPYKLKDGADAKQILSAIEDLLNRVRAGEVSTEQAQKESMILSNLMKAYDIVEVKTKLDALDNILNGRK